MPDLIADLAAAPEGSREFDAEIAVRVDHDFPEPMGDAYPYFKLPHKSDQCAPGTYWLVQRSGMSLRTAPHYTTSLDAKLPGENIVSVTYVRSEGLWTAVHSDDTGEYPASAYTEPLARRVAYMKSIAALKAHEAGQRDE